MKTIIHLVRKEFKQVFRDKAMVRIIFVVPLIQLLVLSYAANFDLRNVRVAVLDQDNSQESRALLDAFFHSSDNLFVPAARVSYPDQLNEELQARRADMTLWIPDGYAENLATGETTQLSVLVDGQNSTLSGRAGGYAAAIVAGQVNNLLKQVSAVTAGRGQMRTVEARTRILYNPELQSRMYMVPGIIVLLVTIISAMLTGMAVVKEKEIGTLEQLMVSPISSFQLIAGKTIPFAVLASILITIATTFAVFWFHIPIRGSILLFAVSALLYLLVTLGIGLLASTVSQTQQQAMFTIWFFLVFGILLSGFFFPVQNMPVEIQYLTYLNPMRYIMNIVRSIFLRGSTFADMQSDILGLGILGVTVFSAAVIRMQKRVD